MSYTATDDCPVPANKHALISILHTQAATAVAKLTEGLLTCGSVLISAGFLDKIEEDARVAAQEYLDKSVRVYQALPNTDAVAKELCRLNHWFFGYAKMLRSEFAKAYFTASSKVASQRSWDDFSWRFVTAREGLLISGCDPECLAKPYSTIHGDLKLSTGCIKANTKDKAALDTVRKRFTELTASGVPSYLAFLQAEHEIRAGYEQKGTTNVTKPGITGKGNPRRKASKSRGRKGDRA